MNTKTNFRTLITAMVLVLGTAFQTVNAQKTEDKVFGYGFAYNVSSKVLYISNIVEGVQNSETYLDATATNMGNQWHDYFKANVDNYTTYNIDESGFIGKNVSSYDKMDEQRTKMMGEYRQNGYEIRKLNYFRYRKTEYSR